MTKVMNVAPPVSGLSGIERATVAVFIFPQGPGVKRDLKSVPRLYSLIRKEGFSLLEVRSEVSMTVPYGGSDRKADERRP